MRFPTHGLPVLLLSLSFLVAQPRAASAAEETVAPALRPARVAQPSPMMVEIRAVLDQERTSLKSLNERFRAAKDDATAQALQREIAQVKQDSEIAILRVQAKHARLAGHDAVAAYLEGAIRTILSPPVQLPASARPSPVLTESAPTNNAQH
jgi:hypothetical protein